VEPDEILPATPAVTTLKKEAVRKMPPDIKRGKNGKEGVNRVTSNQ